MAWLRDVWRDRRRRKRLLLALLVVVMINLPLGMATWSNWRVDRSGVDVTAEVLDARNLGTAEQPRYWLNYRFPEDVDPDQRTWSAEVDKATWDEAQAAGDIAVRVLVSNPAANTADGEIHRRAGLWTTLAADAFLAVVLGLVWRSRRRGRVDVDVVEAVSEVEPAEPGTSWQDLGEGIVRVTGEVVDDEGDELLLALPDRFVRVLLDGRANPVAPRQQATVLVRPLP